MEESESIILENIKLREDLEVSKREYLKIVEESKSHIGVITRPNDGQNEEADAAGEASAEEIMELKNRAHILSEENQVLFQQISVLRSHFDH